MNIYLSVTRGNLTFNNSFYEWGTNGSFTKANLHLSRLQQLTDNTSLFLAGDRQLASKNLDTSEQITLGGPFIVRSYDVGTLSGTQGYTATAELRHIAKMSIPGIWRPLIFIDAACLQIYKNKFTNDYNVFNLYSGGFGLDVAWKGYSLSSRFAHRIGASPPADIVNLVDNNQVWVQFGKSF